MLPLGTRNLLRGLRHGDHQRATLGALALLWVAYRSYRRRSSLIARYEVAEGDEVRIQLPRERRIDAAALEVALGAAGISAAVDLDDDLLAAAPAEDEGEDRQDHDADHE